MKTLLTLLVVILLARVSPAADATAKPNIIFILCDDLGYGDLGVFYQNKRAAMKDRGTPFFTTPHIDTLARDGVIMTQHYCGAPVCAPSRASFLTGLTQGHANVRDNQFDKALANTLTVASVLHRADYATAAIGKWGLQGGGGKKAGNEEEGGGKGGGNPSTWPAYPTKRGFDFYFGYVRHQDGHFHYPAEDHREIWENDHVITTGLDLCYTTDLFTARAKKWIVDQTAARPRQPFFLYLAYDTPHAKLQNPPCAYPAGGGLRGGIQWTGKPHSMITTAMGAVDAWMHPDYENATWDDDHNPATPEVPWPESQKRYANDVRRIDDAVGDLLRLLDDLKIANNTLVVFTSDNGPSIESYLPKAQYAPTFFRGFGPFDGIKRDTWEGGVRIPAIARWPGVIPAGRIDSKPSGQWDWLATFAGAAHLPAPAGSDGVSLLPSLTGQGTQLPGELYIEYFNGANTPNYPEFAPAHRKRPRKQMQAIYMDGYKGIRYDVKSAEDDFEIYDLATDERETKDLGKTPKFAAMQSAMKAAVLRQRKPDADAPRPYDSAPVPSVAEPQTKPGVTWSSYQGGWPWMPDFRTLTPASTGTAETIRLPATAVGVAFECYFHATQDGAYTFTVDSDSSAMLFLHDIRVIDELLDTSAGKTSGTVLLKAGWHPMRLYYRHKTGAAPRLEITAAAGDAHPAALDPAALRRKQE